MTFVWTMLECTTDRDERRIKTVNIASFYPPKY